MPGRGVARRLLGDLVGLYLRGMVEPVPVLPETGAPTPPRCSSKR
jgi:hypothetical protein